MRRFDRLGLLHALLAGLALLLAAAWLWRCWCLFPLLGWNEIRLAPAFMLAHGVSPYPPALGGPATTWIYGPLPILLLLPATLATGAGGALLIAGFINILVTLAGIAAVCGWLAVSDGDRDPAGRLAAFAACVAFWPMTTFQFVQSDNAALAFGLLSLVCLQGSGTSRARWLAAGACAAAIACKQTLLSLALAECAYLAIRDGARPCLTQGLRIGLLTVAAYGTAALAFGPAALGFHLLTLPASLPWAPSPGARIAEFWSDLLEQSVVPLAVLACLGSRAWRRHSPWLLPAIAWAASWPLDFTALLKNGGSINSMHGWLFFLPAAATLCVQKTRSQGARCLILAAAAAMLAFRVATVGPGVWQPRRQMLREGEFLARSLPGQIYFPWHPLVTFYAEGRFDHVEDGLYIQTLARRPATGAAMRAYLPPRLHVMAFANLEMDWGIARALIPPGAQQTTFGAWTLYSWLPPTDSDSSH
jgi:hypothetical protein